jgi:hypothetical protein
VPSLVNDVLCKGRPHEFDLLIGKLNPTGLDGLPSGIKRSNGPARVPETILSGHADVVPVDGQ